MFAVEDQHTADLATFLARHLGFADRIEVIHDRSTNIELPEPADVLVTETLGSFGFEERILSSVIDARARLLRPGATIIPLRVELYAVPVELPVVFDRSFRTSNPARVGITHFCRWRSRSRSRRERRSTSSWKARMGKHGAGVA